MSQAADSRSHTLRSAVTTYAAALVGSYLVFGIIGFAASPAEGASLSASATADALAFAFRHELPQGGTWADTEGSAARGWLVRRAYVRGRPASRGGHYSEQVHKIGWPFTTVRGFVRIADGDIRLAGAGFLIGDPLAGPVRLFPVQPVWPGLIVNSIWIAALLVAGKVLAVRLRSDGGVSA